MRRLRFQLAALVSLGFFLLPGGSAQAADKPRTPAPPQPAGKYACHETHPLEKVTVAAEPGDVAEARANTRLDYFHHGFMPIRVVVTNDSDQPISLDDARILFVAPDNTVENAATDDELQRRLFEMKSVRGTKIPMTPITIHHKPVDQKILADEADFGFKSTTVAPHSTQAGYLYYDTQAIEEPVLQHATLEVRKIRWADTNKVLETFEIPLQPTASAHDGSRNEAGNAAKKDGK